MQRQITVFFRFDDFSETSPVVVEAGLVKALRNNGVCATFAVIPAVTEGSYHEPGERGTLPLGPEKVRFLRKAVDDGAVDVALHGWNHRTVATSSPHSEFVGLAARDQVAKLALGQEFLRRSVSVDAHVFVPPWNNYDNTTLDALAERGFTCISANRYGPCRDGALQFVPMTADMSELRQAVALAGDSNDPNPIIGVLLHPYDFKESGDVRGAMTCEVFDTELRWLTTQPGVRVVPIGDLARHDESLTAQRYRVNQPLPFETICPPLLSRTWTTPFFRSHTGARRVRAVRLLATMATYLCAVAAGFIVERLMRVGLGGHVASVAESGTYLEGALLLALSARAAIRREVHFRSMMVLALLFGMLISGWLAGSMRPDV